MLKKHHQAIIPKALIKYSIGRSSDLLRFRGLPNPVTYVKSDQGFESTKSLQQRELYRIYTCFPIIPPAWSCRKWHQNLRQKYKNICYYSAVEKNINSLVTYPFCHNFCLKNTKFPPKLLRFQIYSPALKHGAIDNQLDKPAE